MTGLTKGPSGEAILKTLAIKVIVISIIATLCMVARVGAAPLVGSAAATQGSEQADSRALSGYVDLVIYEIGLHDLISNIFQSWLMSRPSCDEDMALLPEMNSKVCQGWLRTKRRALTRQQSQGLDDFSTILPSELELLRQMAILPVAHQDLYAMVESSSISRSGAALYGYEGERQYSSSDRQKKVTCSDPEE